MVYEVFDIPLAYNNLYILTVGFYWIDPNEGSYHDAFEARCLFVRVAKTCLPAKAFVRETGKGEAKLSLSV